MIACLPGLSWRIALESWVTLPSPANVMRSFAPWPVAGRPPSVRS